MATESRWVEATLEEENSVAELKDVGLKITHKGGGTRNVRASGPLAPSGDLSFVNLEIAVLNDSKVDFKYQFYEGDDEEHDLVFDAERWLSPLNLTYQIKLVKMSEGGKNVVVRVHRRDPGKVKVGVDNVVSAIQNPSDAPKSSPKRGSGYSPKRDSPREKNSPRKEKEEHPHRHRPSKKADDVETKK